MKSPGLEVLDQTRVFHGRVELEEVGGQGLVEEEVAEVGERLFGLDGESLGGNDLVVAFAGGAGPDTGDFC